MGLFDSLMGKDKIKTSFFSQNDVEKIAPVSKTESEQKVVQKPEPVAQSTGGMYDAELEKLIEFALADGELTEKERQVLFRKAEAKGIDLDEFEMVLEGRLQQRQQEMQRQQQQVAAPAPTPVPTPATAQKSNKYGDVNKCPACGALIESFTACCPECGYEFRGLEANATIQKLFNLLDEVENNMHAREMERQRMAIEKKNNKTALGKLMSDMDDDDDDDDDRIDEVIIKKKSEVIKMFPIPTTKDDILEFLSLAVPLARSQGMKSFFNPFSGGPDMEKIKMRPVWKAKCEQIIMKARFSLKDDKQTLEMIREYANELNIKM